MTLAIVDKVEQSRTGPKLAGGSVDEVGLLAEAKAGHEAACSSCIFGA
jgi:hypothetical protein